MAKSKNWGIVTVTIPNPAAAISPTEDINCESCAMFKLSGTGAYVAPKDASNSDIPLPTTLAEAFTLNRVPGMNLKDNLSFYGTAGDVIMIIWKG